jgi:hypothetical protein
MHYRSELQYGSKARWLRAPEYTRLTPNSYGRDAGLRQQLSQQTTAPALMMMVWGGGGEFPINTAPHKKIEGDSTRQGFELW